LLGVTLEGRDEAVKLATIGDILNSPEAYIEYARGFAAPAVTALIPARDKDPEQTWRDG
jgi:hypothetical protein